MHEIIAMVFSALGLPIMVAYLHYKKQEKDYKNWSLKKENQ